MGTARRAGARPSDRDGCGSAMISTDAVFVDRVVRRWLCIICIPAGPPLAKLRLTQIRWALNPRLVPLLAIPF